MSENSDIPNIISMLASTVFFTWFAIFLVLGDFL
jgi:hypothetical protein